MIRNCYEHQKEVSSSFIKLENANEFIQQLKEDIQKKETSLNQLQNENKNLEVKLGSLNSDYVNLKNRLNEHKEEVKNLQENILYKVYRKASKE